MSDIPELYWKSGFLTDDECNLLGESVREKLGTRPHLVCGRLDLEDEPLPPFTIELAKRVAEHHARQWLECKQAKDNVDGSETATPSSFAPEAVTDATARFMPNQVELVSLTPGQGLGAEIEEFQSSMDELTTIVIVCHRFFPSIHRLSYSH